MKVDETGKKCISEICQPREKLLEHSKCELCPPYFETDSTGKNCILKVCTKLQKITQLAECVDCPEYERA